MRSWAFSQLCLASTAIAAAVAPHNIEHERRDHHENLWTRGDRLHEEQTVPFRVGLTQRNLEQGHEILMGMSDPESENYGKHWTEDEIIDFFSPHDDSINSVRDWLIGDGGFHPDRVSVSTNKQWIQVDAKTGEIEALLQTEYHVFHHKENGKRSIATDKYHVPHHIRDHVDYVTPGVRLLEVSTKKRQEKRDGSKKTQIAHHKPMPEHLKTSKVKVAKDCDQLMTPACLQKLYNFKPGTTAHPGNTIGIYSTDGQTYYQNDLDIFFKKYTNIPKGTHPKMARVDGGIDAGTIGGESEMDLDCIYPIVYPQNVTLYSVDDSYYTDHGSGSVVSNYYGLFNTFLDALDGSYCHKEDFGLKGNTPQPDPNRPHMDPVYPNKHQGGFKGELQCGKFKPDNVISISWSTTEFYTPMNYQRRQCNEFMKLGMQGVSVVLATGDDGVANDKFGFADNGCLWSEKDVNNKHKNFPMGDGEDGYKKTVFNPGFPVTCPYITTVGSTVLPKGKATDPKNEIASTQFGSAGGFSNIYPTPDYQKKAVSQYFKDSPPSYPYYETTYNQSFSPNGGVYNRAGRGFPDVSTNGQNIAVALFNNPDVSGGTSASAPIFAGLLTRINEHRLQAGKKPVGFVNPALYAHPDVLYDITEGNNPGCESKGFEAAKGWDPVTGLGTPNFPEMLDMFMKLP